MNMKINHTILGILAGFAIAFGAVIMLHILIIGGLAAYYLIHS